MNYTDNTITIRIVVDQYDTVIEKDKNVVGCVAKLIERTSRHPANKFRKVTEIVWDLHSALKDNAPQSTIKNFATATPTEQLTVQLIFEKFKEKFKEIGSELMVTSSVTLV